MWWEILGVGSDSTLKDVKRAYAKIIKVAYQSENQEEIIEIQNAYKKACDYIKSQSKVEKKVFIPNDCERKKTTTFVYNENQYEEQYYDHEECEEEKENEQDEEYKVHEEHEEYEVHEDDEEYKKDQFHSNENIEGNTISWEELEFNEIDERYNYKDIDIDLSHCKVKFDPIYTDLNRRFKREEWEDVFNAFSFNEEQYFKENAYKYFNEYYQLPHDIWLLLEENLELSYEPKFIWNDKILNDDQLEYSINDNYSYEEIEEFYKLRNHAYESFLNCEYEEVLKICEKVIDMDIDKPFILKLRGISYFETGNYQFSHNCLKELQGYEIYDIEAKRYIAEMLRKNNKNKKALIILKAIKDKDIKVLNEKKVIQVLKGKKSYLKRFIKFRLYNMGINHDKRSNYENATIIERLLLKNRLFIGNGFYRAICYLVDLSIFFGLILGVVVLVGIIIIAIACSSPIFLGTLIAWYFYRKNKKKKEGV